MVQVQPASKGEGGGDVDSAGYCGPVPGGKYTARSSQSGDAEFEDLWCCETEVMGLPDENGEACADR